MIIGNEEFEQITVTDRDGGVLAVISDTEIISHDDCAVTLTVPKTEKSKATQWNEEIRGYTRIVVETDEDNPKTIAEITNELITSADGYRVRLTPEYD